MMTTKGTATGQVKRTASWPAKTAGRNDLLLEPAAQRESDKTERQYEIESPEHDRLTFEGREICQTLNHT
ncbi:hypothetical protein NO357_14375 [Marimonas arenosa]|uniref:Uncharacterized protein n=1 Tax=Marimonas arenosa TaxID=1795305 RepID=A0AAE4B5F2_9RHOB|nr:hypothetical protein [Marimonas arenosa]